MVTIGVQSGLPRLSTKALYMNLNALLILACGEGAKWLSCRVLGSRPRGRGFEPHPGRPVPV